VFFHKNTCFSLKTPSNQRFEGVLREQLIKNMVFLGFYHISLKTPSKRSFEGVLREKHQKRVIF
jgi:hypothetical protein